jgi:CheY-like chemotaxis protein
MFYRNALMASGYLVVAVEDGFDALRHIDGGETPDAVILDLGLPRLAGRDVKHELRAHSATCNIPILVITGTDASTLNPADFCYVLRKPVTAEGLIQALELCFHAHASSRADVAVE